MTGGSIFLKEKCFLLKKKENYLYKSNIKKVFYLLKTTLRKKSWILIKVVYLCDAQRKMVGYWSKLSLYVTLTLNDQFSSCHFANRRFASC